MHLEQTYVRTQFMQFLARYGRSYSSKSDFDIRFDIFAANLAAIEEHNSQPDITHIKGINQFTDMTESEIAARYSKPALKKPPVQARKPESMRLHQSVLPEYVNWYEAGKVSESVDQTGCGACWAFTTATTLESLNAIVNNLETVPTYSVQYLMDCDDVNWACDGGWMLDAYDFTKQRGIVAWKDYDRTYNAQKNVCVQPKASV
jgi:C1A family cysteine protease